MKSETDQQPPADQQATPADPLPATPTNPGGGERQRMGHGHPVFSEDNVLAVMVPAHDVRNLVAGIIYANSRGGFNAVSNVSNHAAILASAVAANRLLAETGLMVEGPSAL